MMDDPSTRRTERIMKQSDEPNWRSRKWEKPIQEVESPSIVPKTEMSIKLENDDEQNQRSRLKELITQRLEAQSIALATEQENERNQRSRLEEIIKRRIESQSIAQTQTPFIKEMKSDEEDEESETEEDYKKRREFIHAYLTMDNEGEQANHKETETDEGIIGTPEEQKERLIHAYLTMEKDRNEHEEPNRRRELLHAYSKLTMDNNKEQTEQDEIDTYLRTSMEEEQEPSTWEEYDEEEPLEEYEENEPFEESDDERKGTTQLSYPTEEEENALFMAFITGSVEDQKTWIDAKMNLARATTDEETRRREKEILDRIIPTETMDLDEPFEEGDEEETDNLSKRRTYDQENESSPMDRGIYSPLFTEEEELDEFIDENTEEKDIRSLEPLNVSYQNRQDEETVNSLALTTEPNEQLDKARYFPEQDEHWKYDDRRTEDENQGRINSGTDQESFDPTDIFSSLYCPTTSRTRMNETFLNQKSDYQMIETKEERDNENIRQSRGSDLFAEQEGCTPWIAETEYEGLLNPEDQLQLSPMKPNGIAEWPTPTTTTKEVKFFLRFRNFDEEFTQNEEDLTQSKDKWNEKGQDNCDIIMLPERLFPNSLDYGLDDERTCELDDGQFDPIKTLSVREPETLLNHFSKVAAATSVNNVIAVNVTNTDPRKWITMARIVNNMINSLSGKGPNIWEDIFEDWLIWIPQLPNKNTALTNHSTLRHSKPIQILNGKQARQSLFLLEQPDRYMTENTDNQNKILLPSETTIKTIDEKVYRSIEDENNQESPVQNVFDTPTKGILLPWNLRMSWKREDNLLFYIEAFSLGIPPGPLLMNLLKPLGVGPVVEDHGSTEGVITRIPGISEPYKGETTTIPLGTLNKRYELSDKSTFDQRTHFVLHKYEQLPGLKLIAYTAHYPWKNGTAKHINSEIGKSFLPTLIYNTKSRTTRESTQQKLKQRMSKLEGLFKESKKPSSSNKPNLHPISPNHEILSTIRIFSSNTLTFTPLTRPLYLTNRSENAASER